MPPVEQINYSENIIVVNPGPNAVTVIPVSEGPSVIGTTPLIEVLDTPTIIDVIPVDERVVVIDVTPPQIPVVVVVLDGSGGSSGSEGYNFIQIPPSNTWQIVHNLGYLPVVQSFTLGGTLIEGDVVHYSVDNLAIIFLTPVSGRARLA